METLTRSSPAALSPVARWTSPSPFVVSEVSTGAPFHVVSREVAATIPSRPLRRRGSPPVNRTSRTPSSWTPMRTSRTTSSSVRIPSPGIGSIPSAGMQYRHRRLHLSVSETRRSTAVRPNRSIKPGTSGRPRPPALSRTTRRRTAGIPRGTAGLGGAAGPAGTGVAFMDSPVRAAWPHRTAAMSFSIIFGPPECSASWWNSVETIRSIPANSAVRSDSECGTNMSEV